MMNKHTAPYCYVERREYWGARANKPRARWHVIRAYDGTCLGIYDRKSKADASCTAICTRVEQLTLRPEGGTR